jgi:hypothetical protein
MEESMRKLKDMERSHLAMIGVVVLMIAGVGVGLGFAFAGPTVKKDKSTTTTTITCKKGTDDCTVKGDLPRNDNVGPDAPDPTETLPDPTESDSGGSRQQENFMPWADYNGRNDISDLHLCDPYDSGDQDLCYTVTNHSQWDLDYELDLTYFDSSGARIGTDTLTSSNVAAGQVDKTAETEGSSAVMPDGTAKYTLDSVKIVGTECADTGECDYYTPPAN